jgi:hypothetical protein
MNEISKNLRRLEDSRCLNISIGGLVSRSKVAYKWKAPYRSFLLRECVFWRVHDLLSQAHILFEAQHILGSRILIRSAIETVAILVYLNQMIENVILGALNFHEFSKTTSKLLLGSRDGTTKHTSINILTVLKQFDRKYPGITKVYDTLSESAHPNWEGICYGYARLDRENYEENFSNNWFQMWAEKHGPLMHFVMLAFESEYNDIWPGFMKRLEAWIETNDDILESTKNSS